MFAICYKCKKQFIPNKLTRKCMNHNKMCCSACAKTSPIKQCMVMEKCCGPSNWKTVSDLPSKTADEKQWANRSDVEIDLFYLWGLCKDLKLKNAEVDESVYDLQEEHVKLKGDCRYNRVRDSAEIQMMSKENENLKNEVELMKKEMQTIKCLLVNFENPKEKLQGEALMEEINKQTEENAGLKAKFDEMEELEQTIKDIQLDQARVKELNKEIEEKTEEACTTLEGGIQELSTKIDNFVHEVKFELNDKKSQLIREMKISIQKMQEEQKALLGQSQRLQQQSIQRSKLLENKLELVNHKFADTHQMKSSLSSYFDGETEEGTECEKPLPLEKVGNKGSNSSLSTTASFEKVDGEECW